MKNKMNNEVALNTNTKSSGSKQNNMSSKKKLSEHDCSDTITELDEVKQVIDEAKNKKWADFSDSNDSESESSSSSSDEDEAEPVTIEFNIPKVEKKQTKKQATNDSLDQILCQIDSQRKIKSVDDTVFRPQNAKQLVKNKLHNLRKSNEDKDEIKTKNFDGSKRGKNN